MLEIGQREIANTGAGSRKQDFLSYLYGGVYNVKRHTLFLESGQLKRLNAFGKAHGGLKQSQLIRLAITQFIQREARRAARATALGE